MAVNYEQLQHLQKVKNMLQEHHGATQLGNISKSASSQLYEEFNKAERVVLPLDRTVAQAIDFIADIFSAESPMLQFKRFQERMRAGKIIRGVQRLPENKRQELYKNHHTYEMLQIALSPEEFYFHINPREFKKGDKKHNREVFLSAFDDMIIDPELLANSSLETLGIQLDPDCQNLKEIFKAMRALSYPTENETKYTCSINKYQGKYIVLTSQKVIFDATQPATKAEQKKEDVKVTLSVYPDILSMIRREEYITEAMRTKQSQYQELKKNLIRMIKEIERNKKSYSIPVQKEVQEIIAQIDAATAAKIVAEKIYHLAKITGRHSEIDKKHLEASINFFNKRVAELIGISSHVALHAPALQDSMEDQKLNLEMLHAQIAMSMQKKNPSPQENSVLLAFENYFLYQRGKLQEPFLTFDKQIKRACGNSYEEVKRNVKADILGTTFRAAAIVTLQRKALAGFKLEHDLNTKKKTIQEVEQELQSIHLGFRADMTKKERDMFFDELKDLKALDLDVDLVIHDIGINMHDIQ